MGKAFITGGSGFIGNQLVKELITRGQQPVCLVRDMGRGDGLRRLGAELVIGTLEQPDVLRQGLQGCDTVYHLAGLTRTLDHAQFFRVNELATGLLAQACAKQPTPPRLLLVSSLAAAGPSPNGAPRDETIPPAPVSDYGRSKLGGELAARKVADRVPITIVRPPMVLGPGDKTSLNMFKSIATWRLHAIPGFSPKRYSWIDVRQLVLGILAAAERGEHASVDAAGQPGQGVYYLADVEQWTYRQLGAAAAAALGNPWYFNLRVWSFFVGRLVKWSVIIAKHRELETPYMNWDKYQEMIVGDWSCNTSKAQRDLGYKPGEPQTLLNETVAWYRERGWLK